MYFKTMKNNNTMIITNNSNNKISILPIISYSNIDTSKKDILKYNKEKLVFTNELIWNLVKAMLILLYIYLQIKNNYNISYLEREIDKKNSMIYKALLKYGYSSFKLDILEYCEPSVLIKREQYYLDLF